MTNSDITAARFANSWPHSTLTPEEEALFIEWSTEQARKRAEYNAAQAISRAQYDTELERLLKKYDNGQPHSANGFDLEQKCALDKLNDGFRKLDWMLR
jgi:hypothetical protein